MVSIMKSAIVTGSSSGIGLAISKMLLKNHFKVYALARNMDAVGFSHDNLMKVNCDITDTDLLVRKIKEIRKAEDNLCLLVNNAGIGFFGPHEELNPAKIHKMVALNLEAPLILTNLLLRDLKKNRGFVINISSITAKKSSPIGCAYAATKAGLSHFSHSLFDEVRKYGVKVVSIHPDMTKTPFYDNANFREGDDEDMFITPECVAEAVEAVINARVGTVISDITIRPQRHGIRRK